MPEWSSGNQRKHESNNPIQRWLLDRFHDEVARLIDLVDAQRIADLGCGEAYVVDAVRQRGVDAEFTCVDHSATAIAEAERRLADVPGTRFVVGDVHQLDAAEMAFDLVLMLEVLEHLDDPEPILDLLARLTTGHVLLSVPREPIFRGMNLLRGRNVARWGSDPEHVQHWTKRSFRAFVQTRFDVVAEGAATPWTMLLLRPRP